MLSALGSLGSLPRVLHATWKTRIDPYNNDNALIRHGLRGFADANPGWRIEVSSDEDVDRYLRLRLQDSDYNLTRHVHPVEESDLWRLVKLYHESGIYSDIDRLHNQRMAEVITGQTKILLPAFHPSWAPQKFDFTQDFLGASPYNPAIGHALDPGTASEAQMLRILWPPNHKCNHWQADVAAWQMQRLQHWHQDVV